MIDIVASDLADDKIVGWFQGRSEFGPRALGNRSILADPRNDWVKDHLNDEVKHREWWRPYAPIVMEEYVSDWFDTNRPSPHMMFSAISTQPDKVPGITHEDGTSRYQTVNKEQNERVWLLLESFRVLTDVPMLLNTSFNDNGEPIVETPEDALSTFLNLNIDVLVIGRYYFNKEE